MLFVFCLVISFNAPHFENKVMINGGDTFGLVTYAYSAEHQFWQAHWLRMKVFI